MLRKIPPPTRRGHYADIERLTRTELNKKYASEYRSWSNGKSRAKRHGNWDPAFESFAGFLRIMGPRPAPGMTLDRIDNSNPKYGPGLCRWADKRQQAVNRASTRQIECEGQREALPDVARRQGEQPSALRRRLARAGEFKYPSDPRRFRPWPQRGNKEVQEWWEGVYLESGGFERWSRLDFFIHYLRGRAQISEDFIEKNYHEDNEKMIAELRQHREFIANAYRRIEEAIAEKPRWEKAVREYELRQPERRFLMSGSSGYLASDRDEEH